MDPETICNQTPQATVLGDDRICVVWSGRTKDQDWALYLACKDHDRWNGPVKLTSGKEPARAPKIMPDGENGARVVCHYGQGENMVVRLLRISPPYTTGSKN